MAEKTETKVEKTVEKTVAATKVAEKKAENKPVEKKVAEKKPVEKKAVEKKTIKTKTAGTFVATGRRKSSVASARLCTGNGKIVVNGRELEEYLQRDTLVLIAKQPLALTGTEGKYDVVVKVTGGGIAGQAGAIRHAIARALVKENEQFHKELKDAGLLTRDSRQKERKKYGLKKARKASQFSKR